MEAIVNYSQEELAKMEIRRFVNEGLQDVYHNKLLDFDTTFNELEERYGANEWLSYNFHPASQRRYHRYWRLYYFYLISTWHFKIFIKGLKNSILQLKFSPYKFPLVQDDILQSQSIRCMPYKNIISSTKSLSFRKS